MTKMKKFNPELYSRIKSNQDAVESALSVSITMERKCPYCNTTLSTIYEGIHAGEKIKCPICKEFVYFSPVSFRLAR